MKTYGVLELDRIARQWRISDIAPHVAIAFKRLFPRVPETATVLKLSDTDEVRADLEWFTMRYPLATRDAAELSDDSRIKRLASFVLEGAGGVA